ncbi:MAG: sigma 54-interacting transcriptional regulator [Bacteroidota bacterium]
MRKHHPTYKNQEACSAELLRISGALLKSNNPKDLLRVVFETIRPIFPFDGAGVFIINEQNDEHYEILDDIDIMGVQDLAQTLVIQHDLLGKFNHKGSAVDFLSSGTNPHLFDIEKDKENWPHPQFEVMLEAGLRQIMGIGLRSGSELLGMLCFNANKVDFYSEEDFSFFKAISEQVALVVKNLLDNGAVLVEKTKVENLLKISTAASNIQNRQELIKVIFKVIKPIFPLDEAGLFIIDLQNNEHYEILDDIDILGSDGIAQKVVIQHDLLGRFKHKGSAVDFLSRGTNPHLFHIEKDKEEWPHPQIEFMLEAGLKQLIGVGLRSGNELFGMLCFNSREEDFYSEEDFSFFKAISEQVALAVKNLTASEEILRLNEELRQERDYLIEQVRTDYNFHEIIGNSPLLKEVFKSVEMVANTDATVLVEGETGTGKELIARAIHERSSRKSKPLIKVNCATLPRELIESELFGHEKGSFTGAFERRVGKFELAHNGSLFLDEIGEMPLELQAKLLRAIQEKEIERLGGKEVIKVDVRIIAATNRSLKEESEKGDFRSDLYYRLNVFPIRMPALKERKDDIPILAAYFAQKYCTKFKTDFKGIKEKAMQELLKYDWPGNIRELENLIEQACILNQGKPLSWARELVPSQTKKRAARQKQDTNEFDIKAIKKEQEELERERLLKVLKQTNWRIRGEKGAAKILNMKATTLEYRMTKLGLK